MGRNYMTGLLWALETLAWHTDYLMRAIVLLGELAALDPGGNWSNRPSNSLIDILLPWHPQTCAPIPKRNKSAVAALVREQPIEGGNCCLRCYPTRVPPRQAPASLVSAISFQWAGQRK